MWMVRIVVAGNCRIRTLARRRLPEDVSIAMKQTYYRRTYIVGEPIVLYAVDIFPQYCVLLVAKHSVCVRGNNWRWHILTPYVVIYFSQYPSGGLGAFWDSQDRYPSSGFRLSPKCRLAPCTNLENPPGMLLHVRRRTSCVVRNKRHFDSRGVDLGALSRWTFCCWDRGQRLRKAAGGKLYNFVDSNRGYACKKETVGMFAHTWNGPWPIARPGMTSALYPIG
jgi:hypothetical protein